MSIGTKIFWLIFVVLFCLINSFKVVKKNKHFYKIQTAKKVYKNINNIKNNNNGWMFSYLRKIDPFVFEELILLTFKKHGFKVKRNRRYTRDGGIDGLVKKDGKKYLIQAKRYSNYINLAHVKEFIKVCQEQKFCGYFIHTGKTGTETKKLIKNNPQIKLINGEKLYEFFIESFPKKDNLFF